MASPGATSYGYETLRTPAGAYVRVLSAERRLGGVPARVRVARSEDGLRSDLRTLVLLFIVVAPLAVLGAALAGYAISGRALAPLLRMAERARTISADRLSERLPVDVASDELGQLATVFNETFARLESSFDRQGRFTADASHQLRTPLTAIRSVGEVCLRDARTPREYQEAIGSMLEEADRLTALVDALLLLSRWEGGRMLRALSVLDLGDVAASVCGQLSVLAEDRGIALDVTVSTSKVLADEVMTRSALMNVVDNAIKFTPKGGRVRVWSRGDEAWHELVVDDTGPGIPVQDRERVLERFYRRNDANDASALPGAGLGLAIADWAVRANHGRILVDTNDCGGARVILRLPRFDPSTAPGRPHLPGAPGSVNA
jgi:heavy metal sensor kinase